MPTFSSGLLISAAVAAHGYLVWYRLLAYLRYFQQEGYEHTRFLRWTHARSLSDPAFWLSVIGVLLYPRWPTAVTMGVVASVIRLARVQPDPRRSGKITLKMTWRAVRVQAIAFLIATTVWVGLTALFVGAAAGPMLLASAFVYAVAPFVLILSNTCLMPYERRVQRQYEAEAVRRVADLRPFIIGITGSYGKSSSKAILAHILQFHGPTLAASGSINTLMGVTRHIREALLPGHVFMVVEMGAFQAGSITRLCQLTPPSAALITAVGDMHLERFGSLDAIVRAKGELAAALPPDGLLVVNADSAGALRIAQNTRGRRILLYGETSAEDLDTRLEQVEFSTTGTAFVLRTRDNVYRCMTPLLGRPIVLNLAGAFTLACAVGVDPVVAVAALTTLRPVSNRLEVVTESGVTWIRDAYNSNQAGFRAALEVVAALPVTRRFLATPGVIELGAEQFAVNRALARESAAVCDAALVVADTNREAFAAGYRDANREDRLVSVPSRAAAFRWLRETVREGDAVILENDLPDLYEPSGVFWKTGSRS
jgi:UDP-N-acetylmuramoyl-tripeptide--D-alanyl-D-alanine ligase